MSVECKPEYDGEGNCTYVLSCNALELEKTVESMDIEKIGESIKLTGSQMAAKVLSLYGASVAGIAGAEIIATNPIAGVFFTFSVAYALNSWS